MAVATGGATVSTTFTVPPGLASGSYSLVVIANGIPSANYAVHVGLIKIKDIKDVKFEKLEHKEIKEAKFEKLEIKEIKESKLEIKELENKQVLENKLKDAENINQLGGGGDPALASAIQDLNARIDALSAEVQQRAPITPEERPAVGETALQHSKKKIKEHSKKKSKE